jgi:hypothetical protein
VSRENERRVKEASNQEENSQFESQQFEGSRVREFELDSGVIPTVKSEINKESERLSG